MRSTLSDVPTQFDSSLYKVLMPYSIRKAIGSGVAKAVFMRIGMNAFSCGKRVL